MEVLHTVKALLQKSDWMAKVDLKDTFFMHMVPVAPPLQSGEEDIPIQLSLFGLCTTPRMFTKILKPAIERLISMDIRLVVYMNNILIMATAVKMLREHTHTMLFLLENLGFIINSKKSLLTLTQEIEFLGMVVNSHAIDLKLPGENSRSG